MGRFELLDREKFSNFLAWLTDDPMSQGQEYELIRAKLASFFAARRCPNPEELADEVLDRTALKLASPDSAEIENKTAYIYGIAKYVFLESLRSARPTVNTDDVLLVAAPLAANDEELENKCLDKCLGELPDDQRDLILKYFSEEKTEKVKLHKSIAERFGISQTALRMRIMRIKQVLAKCMEPCVA